MKSSRFKTAAFCVVARRSALCLYWQLMDWSLLFSSLANQWKETRRPGDQSSFPQSGRELMNRYGTFVLLLKSGASWKRRIFLFVEFCHSATGRWLQPLKKGYGCLTSLNIRDHQPQTHPPESEVDTRVQFGQRSFPCAWPTFFSESPISDSPKS